MTKIDKEALDYIFRSIKKQPSEPFESEKIEFKNYSSQKSLIGDNELVKEISAFANHKGGTIIVGVIDSSDIKNNEWEKQLNGFFCDDYDETKERLRGKIEPRHEIEVEEHQFEGKYYTLIHVPKSYNYLVGTSSGKFCKRDGKSSIPMTSLEIEVAVKNLHNFDWTAELIENRNFLSLLDLDSIEETKRTYCDKRNLPNSLPTLKFLESLGATKNGLLTRGGLLFLGKTDSIIEHLGQYEYRFSRKSKGGRLLLNEVWSDNIWNSIKRSKRYFQKYNESFEIDYKDQKYKINPLDELAFHEAYLNGIVHRDYTLDGMTVVNYMDDEIRITSPGKFYGGVNEENIVYHEPRHRNKGLANILMKFQFIDRAGMGVLRMGLGSLRYGRGFPTFKEKDDSVQVSMQSEFLRPRIFILTANNPDSFDIPDLLVLNLVYEKGFVKIEELEKRLTNISKDPWKSIIGVLENPKLINYIEFCGTNDGIYIRVKEEALDALEVSRIFKVSTNSEKHVKLYKHLKKFGKDNNMNITKVLGYSQSSSTSNFLKNAKYAVCSGDGRNRRWTIQKVNGY